MAVIVQAIAVIRGENDDRIVEHAAAAQGSDDLAYLRIDHRYVGIVVSALTMQLLWRRVFQMHDRVVVVFLMVLAQPAQGGGLRVQIVVPYRLRQVLVPVFLEIRLRRIVGRVRAGDADLQEERLAALVTVEPCHRHLRHEDVGMHVLGQRPCEGAEALPVVRALAVGHAGRLAQAPRQQRLVPIVEKERQIGMLAVLVLGDMPLVESECLLERVGVHLADIDASVPCTGQKADPAVGPGLVVAEDAVGMGVDAAEQRRARRRAGRRGHVHVVEGGAAFDQAVEVRGFHMIVTQRRNRIEPLLVREDQDDVRSSAHRRPLEFAGDVSLDLAFPNLISHDTHPMRG